MTDLDMMKRGRECGKRLDIDATHLKKQNW